MAGNQIHRRTVVVGGASLMAAACGEDDGTDDRGGDGSSTGDAMGTTGGNGSTDGTDDAADSSGGGEGSSDGTGSDGGSTGGTGNEDADGSGSSGEQQVCRDEDGWLAGGTASMAGDYPDPFEKDPDPACAATSTQTCGPCWAASPERMDITSGVTGLPMRLSFRVLWEGTCEPVEGAVVDVWYANIEGAYSDETMSPICNNGMDVADEDFLRGHLPTDAEGKVHFDAIYPGWYPGRSPHIHVRVDVDGMGHHVTQFYFDDALSDSIYESHPDYSHRPDKDTDNAQDGPFDPAAPNYMDTRKTYDCAMQAWATLIIPTNAVPVNCHEN